MKRVYIAGILIAVGILAFTFAPFVPWASPVIVDGYFTGRVSPSYYLFKCGIVYNVGTVYTENGQFDVTLPGANWLCLNLRL